MSIMGGMINLLSIFLTLCLFHLLFFLMINKRVVKINLTISKGEAQLNFGGSCANKIFNL